MFFDFSNHARAQVPIFTPKMKKIRFAHLARFAPGNGISHAARNDRDGRTTAGRTAGGRANGQTGRRPDERRTNGRASGWDGEPTGGRTERPTGGQATGTILNDSTTIFIDFHKKHPKTLCFSVVSRPAEAQVPIFTAQMKKASKKCQKNTVFFDFSKQANAQVPIFTVQKSIFGHRRGSRQSPGNGARSAAPNPPTTRRGSG